MNYSPKITDQGEKLIADSLTGGSIILSSVMIGNGLVSGDTVVPKNLINPIINPTISNIRKIDNNVIIDCKFSNAELNEGFNWTETGIFAKDSNNKEVLFAYCNTGEHYEYVPSNTCGRIVDINLSIALIIDSTAEISAVIGQGVIYVTKTEFDTSINALQNKINSLSFNVWQPIQLAQFAEMDSYITSSSVEIRYNPALSEVKVHFKPISTGANGDIITGDVIGTVKADYRPAFTQYGTCMIKSSSDVCIRSVEINSEGKITILNNGEAAKAIDNLLSLDLTYTL